MAQLTNKPSFVEYQTLKFLIIDAPNDRNLQQYIREFQKYNVKDLVRACEGTYSTEAVVSAGVRVHDLPFPDGAPPPQAVIDQWLALCDSRFKPKADSKESEGGAIAVHCVAGLGRYVRLCAAHQPCAHIDLPEHPSLSR